MTTIPRNPDDDDGSLQRVFGPDVKARIDALGEKIAERSRYQEAAAEQQRVRPMVPVEDLPAEYYEEAEREAKARRWEAVVPFQFRGATLDWPALAGTEVASQLADWGADVKGRSNLLLSGPVGTGKTSAAVAACRARIESGQRVIYRAFVEALMDLRPDGPDGFYRELIDIPLLILDDVGVERPTGWTVEQVTGIIDLRWQAGRSTVVTTNLDLDGPFEEWIGARAFSRMVGPPAVVAVLAGKDQRREG